VDLFRLAGSRACYDPGVFCSFLLVY